MTEQRINTTIGTQHKQRDRCEYMYLYFTLKVPMNHVYPQGVHTVHVEKVN